MLPPPPDDDHYEILREAAQRGELVFFLGAGVNWAQRHGGQVFNEQADFLPTGRELAEHLARKYDFPDAREARTWIGKFQRAQNILPQKHLMARRFAKAGATVVENASVPDLARVAQYAQVKSLMFESHLHNLFSRHYEPTALHQSLARLPALATRANRKPIFITTNYDTVLEEELARNQVEFDVLFYRKTGPGVTAGPFWHWPRADKYYSTRNLESNEFAYVMTDPPSAPGLAMGDGAPMDPRFPVGVPPEGRARTLVVKIHGTVFPDNPQNSGFVISQDDYVEFLRRVSSERPLPTALTDCMLNSHFTFIGYGLADWNILAICQNLWAKRSERRFNWAIMPAPSPTDVAYWTQIKSTKIQICASDATTYAQELNHRVLGA